MNSTERNQLARRIIYLYHRVLVDIRNWLYEGEIEKARDAADYLEPIAIDYFNSWLSMSEDDIKNDARRMINPFVGRHCTRSVYLEIFDLEYHEFQEKYLSSFYPNNFDFERDV